MRNRPDSESLYQEVNQKDQKFSETLSVAGFHLLMAFIIGVFFGIILSIVAGDHYTADFCSFRAISHSSITRTMSTSDQSVLLTPAAIAGVTRKL